MKTEPNTMENRKAITKCAEWLSYCLSIGWAKEQLDDLEKIWHEHHDKHGNLIKNFTMPEPTASGSVAAPKEEPKEESEPTQRINAAMLLAGFMWKDENKFPKQCVTIHHEKGVSIDETELLPYLMYLVRWVEDAHQLSSLRDQLRQRDELIKELLPLAERMGSILGTAASEHYKELIDRANSIIKKSQKL